MPIIAIMAFRFIARGMGDMDFYLFAGVGSALAMGIRFFLSKSVDARIEVSGMTEDTFNDNSQHFSLVGGLSGTFGH